MLLFFFFRDSCRLGVLVSSHIWFTGLSTLFVICQSYFAFTLGFILQPERQTASWGRYRQKEFWNTLGYNFVPFIVMFRKLIKSNSTSFQKYCGLIIFMVTSHVASLWPIKTSILPKVSPSKVCNLKMWYFAEILCIQNWKTWNQISFCDVTTEDDTKWDFCSCAVLIQNKLWFEAIT